MSFPDGVAEVEEPVHIVRDKVRKLATLFESSHYTLLFTGAGISTSAGVSDYRGPTGVWTRKDKGLPPVASTPLDKAVPTFSHMALRALAENGLVQHLTSQNVDGLHLRSGFPRAKLSELHGNIYVAKCRSCKSEKLHDTRVKGVGRLSCIACKKAGCKVFCHCLSTKCSACGKKLVDSIINFGENLPENELAAASDASEAADLCVVVGSSCKVTPAADIPAAVGARAGANLVIINLQPTPLDGTARLVIRARIDSVMAMLMEELGLADTVLPWVPPRGPPTSSTPTPLSERGRSLLEARSGIPGCAPAALAARTSSGGVGAAPTPAETPADPTIVRAGATSATSPVATGGAGAAATA